MKSKTHHESGRRKIGKLSEDDLNLWQQVQRTVEPLEGREKNFAAFLEQFEAEGGISPTEQDSSTLGRLNNTPNNSVSKRDAGVSGRSFPAAPYSPPVSRPADNPGSIDDKTAKKLLKGRVSIEDRIDLHGMTQDQAHRMLNVFLARSHASGLRMVLVITGKGRTTGGVLRQVVPHWLREPFLSQYVSAFRSAHITHGGEGALYVRLRRNEKTRKDKI